LKEISSKKISFQPVTVKRPTVRRRDREAERQIDREIQKERQSETER
jgi:hypothetical protein